MKILKKQFQKIKIKQSIKIVPGGEKLKYKPTMILKLPTIKIKPKLGRWCEYYEGRIPYPIECNYNKTSPIGVCFNKGEKTITHERKNCPNCKRQVEWRSWKDGKWDKIKYAISQGDDLIDMDPPNQETE